MKITDKMFEEMVKITKLYNVYWWHTDHGRFIEGKIANLKLRRAYLQLQRHYNWSNNKLEKFFNVVVEIESQTFLNTSGVPWDKDLKECEEYLDSLTKEDISFTKF